MATSAVMVAMTERIERRGLTLLWAVAGYGLATGVFGLSRSFALTMLALAAYGADDMVSVVIRDTCISSRSVAPPRRITLAYRSCETADDPASVRPATTARIVENATAQMKPKNTSPPTACAR